MSKKNPNGPIGYRPVTLRLGSQCLNQQRHRVPQFLAAQADTAMYNDVK
jgi:hypothetical protein